MIVRDPCVRRAVVLLMWSSDGRARGMGCPQHFVFQVPLWTREAWGSRCPELKQQENRAVFYREFVVSWVNFFLVSPLPSSLHSSPCTHTALCSHDNHPPPTIISSTNKWQISGCRKVTRGWSEALVIFPSCLLQSAAVISKALTLIDSFY